MSQFDKPPVPSQPKKENPSFPKAVTDLETKNPEAAAIIKRALANKKQLALIERLNAADQDRNAQSNPGTKPVQAGTSDTVRPYDPNDPRTKIGQQVLPPGDRLDEDSK